MELARPKHHGRPYKTAAWQAARRAKLSVQSVCEICGTAPATEVDHINADPWDNRVENLRSACKPCHSARTMRDLNRRRRGAGAGGRSTEAALVAADRADADADDRC
jgi:5-methylcytosine-specific restriction endonuclease McrA